MCGKPILYVSGACSLPALVLVKVQTKHKRRLLWWSKQSLVLLMSLVRSCQYLYLLHKLPAFELELRMQSQCDMRHFHCDERKLTKCSAESWVLKTAVTMSLGESHPFGFHLHTHTVLELGEIFL